MARGRHEIVNVEAGRGLAALLVGGALAGLGGAALALGHALTFVEGMTSGRGFIALALVLFARSRPSLLVLGALLFGLALAAQYELMAAASAVPYQAARALPYLATLVVLAVAPRNKANEDG